MALAGFGAEGRSAADFLMNAGAKVEIFDALPESDFSAAMVADLRRRGAIFHFEEFGPFEDFDFLVRSPGISPRGAELAATAKRGIPFTSVTKMFFDLCPCSIVGVTGTKGKGTTASMIHQALLAAGKDAYLCGNIGAPALDILDKLRPESIVVYELSSFQLMELEKSPQLAVVLMITSEHLDFHATREEYLGAKANIVKFQNAGDRAIINIDYPASRAMAAMTPAQVFQVSRKETPADGAYVDKNFVIVSRGGESRSIVPVKAVPLAGEHNLENVCAAAMASVLLGVPDAVIAQTLRDFKALPHRLEFIREVNGVKYYDDSFSTTPESTIAALKSFKSPKVVILGGSGKNADWSELATALAADPFLKSIIGVGDEWQRIEEAIDKDSVNVPQIKGLKNMQEIVSAAASMARPGEVVLLSPGCASFGMFRNYKDRGEQFAAAVRALPQAQ